MNSKSPAKTPKGVALTLCSYDADEHHVELELSQTRIGKIVKFQFGIMDNEVEEIAGRLVSWQHSTISIVEMFRVSDILILLISTEVGSLS